MRALAIEAMGAITAVGDNLPLSVASIYTNARRYQALATVGADGRAVIGAPTLIGDDVQGVDRLRVLAMLALRECGAGGRDGSGIARGGVPASPRSVRLPMIVCAPALEPFGCDAEWLLQRLVDDADLPIDRDASRVFASGRGELSWVRSSWWSGCCCCRSGRLAICSGSIRWSLRSGWWARWRRGGWPARAMSTGFVPGEAAAALRLSLRTQGDDDDGWPAIITGWGRGVGGGARARLFGGGAVGGGRPRARRRGASGRGAGRRLSRWLRRLGAAGRAGAGRPEVSAVAGAAGAAVRAGDLDR